MTRTAGLLAALAAFPPGLLACPVCFGKADGQAGLFQGLTWGIAILLAATLLALGAFVCAVWRIERAKSLREGAR